MSFPKSKRKKNYAKIKHLSLLQTLPDVCCELCNCDCLNNHRRQITNNRITDKNNNHGKKKPKKFVLRSRSVNSYSRDCEILKNLNLDELPEKNYARNNFLFQNLGSQMLCESMQNLCLSPRVSKAFNQIPQHDQKIVNRMARSRSEKAMLNDNAWLAQKFWENEKYERDLIKCEQTEEYKKAINEKQLKDYRLTKARLEQITQRNMEELKHLSEVLQDKDRRCQKRLQTIKLERDILQCQRRQDECRKWEAVLVAQEEQHLDTRLREQDIYNRLENRLVKADKIRNNILDAYMRRLKYDNCLEQALHEANYQEAQQFERFKKEELKQHITRKKIKTEKFIQRKTKKNNESVEKAKIAAGLRDLVRRSVSPEGYRHQPTSNHCRSLFDRSLSNLSFQSSIKFTNLT